MGDAGQERANANEQHSQVPESGAYPAQARVFIETMKRAERPKGQAAAS
jgi:hypothetical protein